MDTSSLLMALSEGLKGGIQGYKDMDDRKMRQMEFDAKRKAEEQDKMFKQIDQNLKARDAGYRVEYDPDGKSSLVADNDAIRTAGQVALAKTDPLDREYKRSQIARLNADVAQAAKPDLKTIPAGDAVAFGDSDAAIKALDAASGLFYTENPDGTITPNAENSALAGPTASILSKLKGKFEIGDEGKQAKLLDAQLSINAQNIGKYLEGGKLAEADIARYKKMLPNLSDSPEVQKKKTEILKKLISDKKESSLKSLGDAGYNVSGLIGGKGLIGQAPGGLIKDQPKSAQAEDPQIKKFAEANGVDYQTAFGIIEARKAKKAMAGK